MIRWFGIAVVLIGIVFALIMFMNSIDYLYSGEFSTRSFLWGMASLTTWTMLMYLEPSGYMWAVAFPILASWISIYYFVKEKGVF